MSGDSGSPLFTKKGLAILRKTIIALILLIMFMIGYWILNQTLDSVVIFGSGYVNVPGYPLPVDVWTYHDFAYTLLWLSYIGIVVWEIRPWGQGNLTYANVLISILGFAILTAGLWLAQDTMNAVLVLDRNYVDYPFFLVRLSAIQTRDMTDMLTPLGYVSFYVLMRISKTLG